MIHLRIDDNPENSQRRFACGIGPELPPGDQCYFHTEPGACLVDCPGCNPSGPIGPNMLGTPISELSGRPGTPGYAKFVAIAKSWGLD